MSVSVLFRGRPDDPKTLEEVVGVAMGAASSCWESLGGTGRFQAEVAAQIVEDVLWWIEGHYELKDEFK